MRRLSRRPRTLVWQRDAPLPNVCIGCGGADARAATKLELRWMPTWVVVGLPFGLVPMLILGSLFTRRSTHVAARCAACAEASQMLAARRRNLVIAGVGSVPAGMAIAAGLGGATDVFVVAGASLALFGPMAAFTAWAFISRVRPRALRIDATYVCISNVSSALAALPDASNPHATVEDRAGVAGT